MARTCFCRTTFKRGNPVNELVKQKNTTVNYRNKCDFFYILQKGLFPF